MKIIQYLKSKTLSQAIYGSPNLNASHIRYPVRTSFQQDDLATSQTLTCPETTTHCIASAKGCCHKEERSRRGEDAKMERSVVADEAVLALAGVLG